jgi:hypothetical protein
MSYDRRPRNAWKHGGYSNLGVLPGESAQVFKRLHQSLIDELEPSGPTEYDAVLSLAKSMWRKSRLAIYAQIAEPGTKADFVDPLQPAFDAFAAVLKDDPRPTPPEWLAMAKDLSADRDQKLQLAKLGEQITPEKLIEEIELAGRLDARIDRLLKRLFQLKAAKQMVGLGSRPQDGSSPVRKLSSSPASRANGGGQVAADKAYAADDSRTAS